MDKHYSQIRHIQCLRQRARAKLLQNSYKTPTKRLQNSYKTPTKRLQNAGGELGCYGRASISYSTSDNRREYS